MDDRLKPNKQFKQNKKQYGVFFVLFYFTLSFHLWNLLTKFQMTDLTFLIFLHVSSQNIFLAKKNKAFYFWNKYNKKLLFFLLFH